MTISIENSGGLESIPLAIREIKDVNKAIDNVRIQRILGILPKKGKATMENIPNKRDRSQYSCIKYAYLLDAPFKIGQQCCTIMKKAPTKRYEKQTGRKPILGQMASESRLRLQQWLKNGCNGFNMKRPASNPMSFWTDQDVLEYLKKYNIPYASVYGDIIEDSKGKLITTGCNRTGCVFCGFGCHLEKEPNRFQRLKQTHPKLWGYCMKPCDEGGLGMKEVLEFIGVKIE